MLTLKITSQSKRTYEKYRALSAAISRKYASLIIAAHPETAVAPFHLAHNWGNDRARALLEEYYIQSGRINTRGDVEYNMAYHFEAHAPATEFKPAWCPICNRSGSEREYLIANYPGQLAKYRTV